MEGEDGEGVEEGFRWGSGKVCEVGSEGEERWWWECGMDGWSRGGGRVGKGDKEKAEGKLISTSHT